MEKDWARLDADRGLSGRWATADLGNFDESGNENAVVKMIQFVRAASGGLFFYGDVGRGKTHLGVAAIKFARTCLYDGLLITVRELLRNLRNAEGTFSTEELLALYEQIPLLVLDDIGSERTLNAYGSEQLLQIVDSRWRDNRATIFISNEAPAKLANQVGKRTISRIMGLCNMEVLEFQGPDHRCSRVA